MGLDLLKGLSFIKKIGLAVAKGIGVAVKVAPTAAEVVGIVAPQYSGIATTVQNDLAAIAAVVVNVQQIGAVLGTEGPEKLRAAAQQVTQILLQSAIIAGHPVIDPAKFNLGSTKITDGVYDILNSISGANVQVIDVTANHAAALNP